jgi:hypothetical protein
MTRGVSDTLPTHLPARYRRGVLWDLDKRSEIAREVTADLVELSQDVGGWDSLSTQQRILCERIVFMRRRALEFESAVMAARELPFEHGAYSNICNVLAGYLKALGLARRARMVQTLREIMNEPDDAAQPAESQEHPA